MEISESYDGLVRMLDSLYEEVDGCSFYEYLFPDKYLLQHPDARKADVIRGTGLSKPIVYKYYDALTKK